MNYRILERDGRFNGAGSVQMAATGALLQQAGCALWDLGMELDYKLDLGAQTIPRADFLRLLTDAKQPVHHHHHHQQEQEQEQHATASTAAGGGGADGAGADGAGGGRALVLEFRELQVTEPKDRKSAHDILKQQQQQQQH